MLSFDLIDLIDLILRLAFCGGTMCVIFAAIEPRLCSFLKYGKTLPPGEFSSQISHFCVPKSWFSHFYIVSLLMSLTGVVCISNTPWWLPNILLDNRSREACSPIESIFLVLLLNLIQSVRRLYECICVSKTSPHSKMQITHYIAGLFFYTAINLHVVIEGVSYVSHNGPAPFRISLTKKNMCAILVFLAASIDQFYNHAHLASLRKYSVPWRGLFKSVACAHYFDEVVIYTVHFYLLKTYTAGFALLWVAVNLSVSAMECFAFYQQLCEKKGETYSVKHCIIPYLF